MEAVVYEDISDAATRLERLKVALLAFVGAYATSPSVIAILLPVDLLPALSSSSTLSSKGQIKETIEARVRQACADRVQLRKWLQQDLGLELDLWVTVAIEPRDSSELSLLANWQLDRHRSPLRQADIVSLSLREVAALWVDERRQAPLLSRFLLSHQSLLLDVTCCLDESSRGFVDPAVFSSLRRKHVAKGRTSVVAFYNVWLPLTSTPRGLSRLQKRLRDVATHVLSPMQLPFCCSYGGDVESLQHNLVTVPFSRAGGSPEMEGSSRLRLSAALLATRSQQDILSLLGLLFGHPLVKYYNEVMAFCASVQKRQRAAKYVYAASGLSVKTANVKVIRRVRRVSSCDGKQKRSKKEKGAATVAPVPSDTPNEAEEQLWCEDLGKQ